MKVVVDNLVLTDAAASVADGLSAARLDAQRRGRVVVEAVLDGETLPDSALSDPSSAPTGAKELRFVTANPAELVGSTLRGVASLITDLKTDQAAAADLLMGGQVSEAMDRLHAALRAWGTIRDAVVDGTTLLGLQAESISVPGKGGSEGPLSDRIRKLADCLHEVKRSIGAEDWSGLSDVLGYEMQDQADEWEASLAGLANRVWGDGGSGTTIAKPRES
jgi:hypothetical protein